jgi:DNA-binding IscR family transcriptional regulator
VTAPVCGLGPILMEAERAFREVLSKYTLADILNVRGKGRYKQLLGGS